jgi:hypothetical protein
MNKEIGLSFKSSSIRHLSCFQMVASIKGAVIKILVAKHLR